MNINQVEVKIERLVNIGNYQNITISVKAICHTSSDNADNDYTELAKWAKSKVNMEVKTIEASLIKRRGKN